MLQQAALKTGTKLVVALGLVVAGVGQSAATAADDGISTHVFLSERCPSQKPADYGVQFTLFDGLLATIVKVGANLLLDKAFAALEKGFAEIGEDDVKQKTSSPVETYLYQVYSNNDRIASIDRNPRLNCIVIATGHFERTLDRDSDGLDLAGSSLPFDEDSMSAGGFAAGLHALFKEKMELKDNRLSSYYEGHILFDKARQFARIKHRLLYLQYHFGDWHSPFDNNNCPNQRRSHAQVTTSLALSVLAPNSAGSSHSILSGTLDVGTLSSGPSCGDTVLIKPKDFAAGKFENPHATGAERAQGKHIIKVTGGTDWVELPVLSHQALINARSLPSELNSGHAAACRQRLKLATQQFDPADHLVMIDELTATAAGLEGSERGEIEHLIERLQKSNVPPVDVAAADDGSARLELESMMVSACGSTKAVSLYPVSVKAKVIETKEAGEVEKLMAEFLKAATSATKDKVKKDIGKLIDEL